MLLSGLAVASATAWSFAGELPPLGQPALWAVYYTWYQAATGTHGQWKTWIDETEKSPHPKPRSKAQPLIGYYDSDNPEVVRWHVRLAKAAGIDAFLVDWWGGAASASAKASGIK